MKKTTLLYILSIVLSMSTASFAQNGKPTNYVSVAGPITFENTAYNLSWSAHPAANFYKQEYLPKGANADKYSTMLLLDVVTGETTAKEAVATKTAELKRMKESNPMVNYDVITNAKTGEYLIDLLVSANAPDGSISIVERNVYRYKSFTDKAGHKGVLLFGVSTRAYGAGVTSFLTALKTNKNVLQNAVAQFTLPGIALKNQKAS